MSILIRRLTHSLIQQSPEIQAWLTHFEDERAAAIEMLLRLQFISRDTYAEWLKGTIESTLTEKCAVYSVLKFKKTETSAWDDGGQFKPRQGASLGSEDFVQSVVANIKKNNTNLIDHPAIDELRGNRVKTILFLDDSIGSGDRISGFIRRILAHPSVLSWWSYNKIRFHVIAFARITDAEDVILDSLPGANRKPRLYPLASKVLFQSHFAQKKENYSQRWGPSWRDIVRLCSGQEHVPPDQRLGYKHSMGNTLFYHSVPNNLPGLLWFDKKGDKKRPLFPRRSLPAWMPELLEGGGASTEGEEFVAGDTLGKDALDLLSLIRRGVRNEPRLAWMLGLDVQPVRRLTLQMRSLGLISVENRITEAGRSCLRRRSTKQLVTRRDWSLHIPTSWCAGQETVQPTGLNRESAQDQSESSTGFPGEDGEVGETSLEGTDAKTATPSMAIMPQSPSRSRLGHDSHGHKG